MLDPRNAFEKAVEANPADLNRNVLNEIIKKGQCEILEWTITFISDRGLWNFLFNREKKKVLTMLFLENYIDVRGKVYIYKSVLCDSSSSVNETYSEASDCVHDRVSTNLFRSWSQAKSKVQN